MVRIVAAFSRVVEPEDRSDDVEMLAFMRAAHSVQRSIDALDPQWRDMMVMALRQMDPAARAKIDDFNRAIRGILEEVAREAVPAALGRSFKKDFTYPR